METRAAGQTKKTEAQKAFLASGLTYEQVAHRVNLSPDYLKTQLRTGCQCYVTAERLRRVLHCPVEYFLPRPKPTKMKERGRATTRDHASASEQQRAKDGRKTISRKTIKGRESANSPGPQTLPNSQNNH